MLPGGVLADQLDRRRVVAYSQWAQGASALWLAIAIAADRISVWQIIGAALIVGIAQSFSAPAYHAMTLDLLDDRSRLPNAIAMNSLQFNLSRVIGPLLASLALTAWGPFWCFFLNAVSFLPLIWVLGRIKRRQGEHEGSGSMMARLREGFVYVLGDRLLLLLLGAASAVSLFGYPHLQLMPVLARKLFRNEAAGNGYLFSAIGIGALLAALTLSMYKPPRMMAAIVATTAIFGVTLAAAGSVHTATAVMTLLMIAGAGSVASLAMCNILIQQRTPDTMRGRVLSMYTFAWFAFVPLGNLIAGTIAERADIVRTFLFLGGGLVLTAVAVASGALRVARAASLEP
jgi:MFS family permease